MAEPKIAKSKIDPSRKKSSRAKKGMRIFVTPEHISTAKQRDSHHCMIADAIRDTVPNAKFIMVDLQSIRFTDFDKMKRYVFLTPPEAQYNLLQFDKGQKVEPFDFSLNTGIVKPAKKTRDTKNRKQRKYTKTSKFKAATTKTRRVSKEREYGIRMFT